MERSDCSWQHALKHHAFKRLRDVKMKTHVQSPSWLRRVLRRMLPLKATTYILELLERADQTNVSKHSQYTTMGAWASERRRAIELRMIKVKQFACCSLCPHMEGDGLSYLWKRAWAGGVSCLDFELSCFQCFFFSKGKRSKSIVRRISPKFSTVWEHREIRQFTVKTSGSLWKPLQLLNAVHLCAISPLPLGVQW